MGELKSLLATLARDNVKNIDKEMKVNNFLGRNVCRMILKRDPHLPRKQEIIYMCIQNLKPNATLNILSMVDFFFL